MSVLSSFALHANLKVKGRPASLPSGKRIYAVGDVHGRLDLLEDILSLICLDIAESPTVQSICVFLGDYIDRGLRSRETIDRLIAHGS